MGLTGTDIRSIRKTFGWSIEQFAKVLSVHPVTLNRWELAAEKCPPIEGMAHPVLVGLRQRVLGAGADPDAIRAEARDTAAEVERILIVGGVLLAIGLLIAFASGSRR